MISQNFAIFFNICKYIFGVGTTCGYEDVLTKRRVKQVLAGQAPTSQTVGSLLRIPGQQSWTEKI
jgi:hypothetical protein